MLTSLVVNARLRYVSTTGTDGASGDITHPWRTWQYGFYTAVVGDTVYFRGGVYYSTGPIIIDPRYNQGHNGTPSSYICFFNYPGEVPILDCSRHTCSPNYGIY